MGADDIRRTLNDAGINASALDKIRLARGVVGKVSYVAGAAVLALGVVAWSLRDPVFLIVVALIVLLTFLVYLGGILWFANKHPGVALLEGAELIQWRQLEMGRKHEGVLPPSPPTTPPAEITYRGSEEP